MLNSNNDTLSATATLTINGLSKSEYGRKYRQDHKAEIRERMCLINMIHRCYNEKHKAYKNYGGRGIKICDRWLGKNGLENFKNDMGPRPENYTIDRIDNDGNYEPSNCRWATRQQQQNNFRNNRKIDHFGTIMTIAEAARLTGISPEVLRYRAKKGEKGERLFRPLLQTIGRGKKRMEFDGQLLTFNEVSQRTGIKESIIRSRYDRGIRGEQLFVPVFTRNVYTQRGTFMCELNGETVTLAQAARITGISYDVLKIRFKSGCRGDRLFRPVKHKRKSK